MLYFSPLAVADCCIVCVVQLILLYLLSVGGGVAQLLYLLCVGFCVVSCCLYGAVVADVA